MIGARSDYLAYLEANGITLARTRWTIRSFLLDDLWAFQRLMRRVAYLVNCRKSRLLVQFTQLGYKRLSRKLGYTIPINVFGPGLSIAHGDAIVVNSAARIGGGTAACMYV